MSCHFWDSFGCEQEIAIRGSLLPVVSCDVVGAKQSGLSLPVWDSFTTGNAWIPLDVNYVIRRLWLFTAAVAFHKVWLNSPALSGWHLKISCFRLKTKTAWRLSTWVGRQMRMRPFTRQISCQLDLRKTSHPLFKASDCFKVASSLSLPASITNRAVAGEPVMGFARSSRAHQAKHLLLNESGSGRCYLIR